MDVRIEAKNLYEYLDAIREMPGIYVGQISLSALYFHIAGYIMACNLKDIREDLVPDFFQFYRFVVDYYCYKESPMGWKNIILHESNYDEIQALETFYNLLGIFRTIK